MRLYLSLDRFCYFRGGHYSIGIPSMDFPRSHILPRRGVCGVLFLPGRVDAWLLCQLQEILLAADQRNYVATGYFQAVTTAKVIVQMVLAIKFQNFYLYLVLELLSGKVKIWI